MNAVFALAGGIALFVLFAWIARRLLGVRRLSTSRTLVSSLVGLVSGVLVGAYLRRQDIALDLVTLAALALALLFTMVSVIVFETLLGPRGRRPRGPSLSGQWAKVRRSAQVTRIFSRHGLAEGFDLARGRSLDPEAARAFGIHLRQAFEEAGGVFVKLGQLLATRPDVVPPETAAELERLHSMVAPAPESEVRPVLEAALGWSVPEVFSDFNWTALGSASIGQVYRARLTGGSEVVVKVRRPGVAEAMERDLAVLEDLSRLAERQFEQARVMGLIAIVAEFSDQLRRELDYRVEARNIVDVAHALVDRPGLRVPAVFAELSSDTVLVLEFMPGTSVGDLDSLPENGPGLADDLFEAELGAMLSGAAFHADLHPGNILVNRDKTLSLVDFGAIGKLDTFERAAVGDILTALEIGDPSMLREAALEVGMRSSEQDITGLDRSFSRLMADHLSPGRDPSVEVIGEFLNISHSHGLRMPASISVMLRALATLDGSLRLLSPGFNILTAARQVARQEIYDALSPETLGEDLKREVVRLAPLLRRAPYQLDRITGQLARGEVGVRVSLFSTDSDTLWLGRMANRALMAFLGAVLGIVSVMLFQTTGGPELTRNISLFQLLGYIGLFGGAILIMRVILEVLGDS